ncbi:sulfatase [Pedobacter heparinus]|uniref:sulfatase n=1 Tax=Pedobacter heparinus TaxID=984 RepID=UPI00292D1E9A|nr:sulfatase [Pedobacter heparinus]
MKRLTGISIAVFLMFVTYHVNGQAKTKPAYNVLFIFVDDLRPELGCYGNNYMHTPNIDQLAATAVVFKKQFVTVPTCGASRASILTGMLPRSLNDLSNEVLEHKKAAGTEKKEVPESFVHALRNNGYYTVGIGKISHSPDGYIYKYLSPKGTEMELPHSWDEMLLNAGKWGTGWNAFFGYADGSNRNQLKGEVKPYESADVADELYPDGLTANLAVSKLQELAGKKQPFFMGVGFFKPHLPFNAPKKYWDLYDESKIALTSSPQVPLNVNPASFHQSGEFNGYKLGEEKAALSNPVSDAYARKLRHAYYAGVSYVDAQIGKVLAELKKSNLEKNTIIVLWGDHGWHLGDDRVWGKHTISEYALRSPLIIKVPGTGGASCDKVVSSVDVYPTLMELCKVNSVAKTDGRSLLPLLKNPADRNWNNIAYSYFKKGITVRTDQYRFTRYFRKEQPVDELYDHRTDPYENINIALANPDVIGQLMPLWTKGNTGLYQAKTTEKMNED